MYRKITRLAGMLLILVMTSTAYGQNAKTKAPKFGKGINYINEDSTFSFKFNFRMSSLYIATFDEAAVDDDPNQWTSQFLIRRSRIKFGGFALTPKLKYKVELGLSNRDISTNGEDGNTRGGARIILDAVLKWQFTNNWELWVGQTKLPGNRERVISSGSLQFVDRSLVNSRFNIDRDAGIQLRGKFKAGKTIFKPSFSISQGEGRNITSQNFGGHDYTAHLDILPLGSFSEKGDYFAADLAREQSPKISFGFTFDYNDGAVRQGGQLGSFVRDSMGVYAPNSLTTFMADMVFKYKGFSLSAEYATKSADKQIEKLSRGFRTGNGFVVQTGYLLKNNVEFAARYTTIRRDDDFSGLSDENEITLGISKYVVGHNLKVQADVSRTIAPDAEDGEVRIRAQVEMQF